MVTKKIKEMNKLKIYFIALLSIFLKSCIENEEIVFTNNLVEFDAAAYNAKSVVGGVAKDYPLLTRIPGYGVAVANSNPTITRASGTVKLRVNLVGALSASDQEISYKVVPEESTAIAGTHYTALSGKVTIPANSNFGEIDIPILNTGTSSATPVRLVLELEGNSGLQPSNNYKRIGVNISQS